MKVVSIVQALSIALAFGAIGCNNPAANTPSADVGAPQGTAEPAVVADAQEKPQAAGAGLAITPATSKIGFIGSKVTGSHEGVFGAFTGSLELDRENLTSSKVVVEIDLDSVKTDSEKLDVHLKSPDFFDVANHPKATFTSTSIAAVEGSPDSYTVTGDLSLHGVTKSVSFPATLKLEGDSPKVAAEFSINRKDFNIVYPGMPDDLIRDEVVIKLDLNPARAPKI